MPVSHFPSLAGLSQAPLQSYPLLPDVLTLYPSDKHHTDASHPHTSRHLRALWTFSLPRADTWLPSPPTFSFFPVTLPALPQTLRLLLSVEEMSPLEGSEPLASPLKAPFPGPSFPIICSSPPLPPAQQHIMEDSQGFTEPMLLAPCSPSLLWSSACPGGKTKTFPSLHLTELQEISDMDGHPFFWDPCSLPSCPHSPGVL